MEGLYKYKSGQLFNVIKTKKGYERGNCKSFGNRLFSVVTQEDLEKELLTGEIERI